MKSLNKKGQVANLQAIIMTLVVIGLLLGVGFLVLREFTDNLGDTAATVTNETVSSASNTTWNALAYNKTNTGCWNTFSVTTVYNQTDDNGTVISSGNYTTDWRGYIKIVGADFNGDDINVTYTYKWSASEACDAIEDTIDAEEEIPTWLAIVVLMLVVGIILTLVFKVLPVAGGGAGGFGFGGGGGSSGTVAEI